VGEPRKRGKQCPILRRIREKAGQQGGHQGDEKTERTAGKKTKKKRGESPEIIRVENS